MPSSFVHSVFAALFSFLICLVARAQESGRIEEFPRLVPDVQLLEVPIEDELDSETIRAAGLGLVAYPGQVLAIKSQNSNAGIIGFVEVTSSRIRVDGQTEIIGHVLRLSRYHMVRPRDTLVRLDLRGEEPLYRGHTELLIRNRFRDVSARYRPLFTQGFSIGETAQTLGNGEIFAEIFGNFGYGLTDWWSVGSLVTGFFLDSPNANMKWRLLNGTNDTVSMGLNVTKVRASPTTAVNLTLYWDSVTSDYLISHTLATFAVATLQNVEDNIAIKTAGTSSLQTGYEALLSNWDRVLFGPNYNFEAKTIGGYVAYLRIWDHFHLSGSISTVDLREMKLDPKIGYVALIEAYWRY